MNAIIPIVEVLRNAGIDTAQLDARMLVAHAMGISRTELLMLKEFSLTPAQQKTLDALVDMRVRRVPMAQILGRREFWGLTFKVTKDTLDPRPDSETLIEALIHHETRRSAKLRMLDLGTGTGCLLLSALSEYPQSTGLGIDQSQAALDVALENARNLGMQNRAEFKKSDWNSEIKGVWNVVISNPPYIPTEEIPTLAPEVAQHEPKAALDGGSDGLDCYLRITSFLPEILAEEGLALLEVGAGQAQDVAALATANGLRIAGITRDLSGIERCVVIRK